MKMQPIKNSQIGNLEEQNMDIIANKHIDTEAESVSEK